MKKIFHLSTCDTCQRILKELEPPSNFILQDIKNETITPDQLESMAQLSGSYESLFSKRARLYKERNLKEQKLSEEHYTFLKRPVVIIDNDIFVGNSKAVVAAAKAKINS